MTDTVLLDKPQGNNSVFLNMTKKNNYSFFTKFFNRKIHKEKIIYQKIYDCKLLPNNEEDKGSNSKEIATYY
jgi:hypothetical protein